MTKYTRGGTVFNSLGEYKMYTAWANMKHRCYNKKNSKYKYYGGRGITVCEEWLKFSNFMNDMGESYELNLTLDRIDNSKGYTKSNCRWATMKEQENNRTNNHRFMFNGMYLTLTEWSAILGINRSTLAQRYYCYKWTIDKTLSTNVQKIG